MTTRRLLVAPMVISALALSACGSGSTADQNGTTSTGKLAVVASFYPLQFATEQVGGGHLAVTSLTKPGAEPHDIELTPRDVATVSKARLVVYEKGLQGAVDQAVESQGGDRSLDIAPAARLDLVFQETVGAPAQETGENAPGTTDPHFWLDPQRYSDVAKAIAQRLSSVDPANKADYEKNAKAFEDKLRALGHEFTAGLAGCRRKELVTSHAAFGYLAERFGLKQIAITGISPDQEPKAAELAAVSTYAKAHGVTTIYAETLVSPAIAQTVASESGARIATLDPIEGLTDKSAGKDYFEVMRSNLKTLRAGQSCS
ncbi:MAG: metal ABC transporter substrate-binding protein [Chloroflexota bacterium]|nr:metal ABC transporter substrate-binding protein [Chloroflexota bacterium]